MFATKTLVIIHSTFSHCMVLCCVLMWFMEYSAVSESVFYDIV